MAWFGQYLGTAYTGDWWGDAAAPAVETPNQGGWPIRRGRVKRRNLAAEIEAERQALGIGERASRVIEAVARSQVRDDSDEIDRTRELLAALEAADIAWRREYDAALGAYREAVRLYEISTLFEIGGLYAEIERREQEDFDARVALLLLTQ